jgi:ABC-type antimicrobial peptide transport system, permease component
MTLFETLLVAVHALVRNKLRSFLTMLGVIIGVGAVIAMLTIGEGAKARVQEAFAQVGANMLIIMSGTTMAGGAQGGFGTLPTLTWEDLKAVQTEVPSIRAAAPVLRTTGQVQTEDQNWSTSINGTTPEYFEIRNWSVAHGVLFTQSDIESGPKVAVFGQTVVDKLYGPYIDPVGQTVRIKKVPFQIIGVLARKGQSPTGQDYDDAVFVPHTTFQAKIQGGLQKYIAGVIMVGATSSEATSEAEIQITDLLRDRHHIQPGIDDDFSIRNLTEMAAAYQEETRTLSGLLASIATFSLLVGGIGIMNIMLVSVTERTREIGLRMAVGAKPRDILAQFLVESLTLSIVGGLIGVVLGILGAYRMADYFDLQLLIRADVILVAVGFSTLVGIVFGLYPAFKASRLDPITALRFE